MKNYYKCMTPSYPVMNKVFIPPPPPPPRVEVGIRTLHKCLYYSSIFPKELSASPYVYQIMVLSSEPKINFIFSNEFLQYNLKSKSISVVENGVYRHVYTLSFRKSCQQMKKDRTGYGNTKILIRNMKMRVLWKSSFIVIRGRRTDGEREFWLDSEKNHGKEKKPKKKKPKKKKPLKRNPDPPLNVERPSRKRKREENDINIRDDRPNKIRKVYSRKEKVFRRMEILSRLSDESDDDDDDDDDYSYNECSYV